MNKGFIYMFLGGNLEEFIETFLALKVLITVQNNNPQKMITFEFPEPIGMLNCMAKGSYN